METKLNQQESLRIISQMISEARNSFSADSSKSMTRMGWAVAALALCNFALIYLLPEPSYSFFLWLLMIPISLVNSYVNERKSQSQEVVTHLQKIIQSTWNAFGMSIALFLSIIFLLVYMVESWHFVALITPVILVLTGLAQYITGVVCKFRPYVMGAFVFWVGALISVFVVASEYAATQFVILALCMVFGFIIPSHKLRKIASQNV